MISAKLRISLRRVFTYASVKEAIRLSDRYIRDKPFPAKALLLDDTAVAASQKRIKLITPELISETVSIKTNVPVGETTATEKERLLNLEDILHKRVIGQDEASAPLPLPLRARSGLSRENKPVGTFLLLVHWCRKQRQQRHWRRRISALKTNYSSRYE